MNLTPEFVLAQDKRLVALSGQFTPETRTDIPAMWHDFWSRDWQFQGVEEQAAYGVSYNVQPDGAFSYAIGRNIDPIPEPLPDQACLVTLSAGRYAVFRQHGPVTELPAVFDQIFSQWLPDSGVSQRDGAVFERYPYDENASPESMKYEIWVPVAD